MLPFQYKYILLQVNKAVLIDKMMIYFLNLHLLSFVHFESWNPPTFETNFWLWKLIDSIF